MGKAKRKAAKAEQAAVEEVAVKASGDDAEPEEIKNVNGKRHRKNEKPLVLCARGITFRYRHLMTDLMQLIPHNKSDSKLDTKHDWNVINEIAELKVC